MRRSSFGPAFLAVSIGLSPAAVVAPAHADVVVRGTNPTQCMGVNSSNVVTVAACNGGANQNFFNTASYGPQVFNGRCVQGTGEGQNLTTQPCNGSRDQKWLSDTNGQYRNEGGWCAEVRGVNVVSTNCGDKTRARASTVWARGTFSTGANQGVLAGARPGAVFYGGRQTAQASMTGGSGMVSLVAQGGGNIVAQGGGNLVAQGGGNIVAQGGGNIVSINGGALVAQGGGN